MGSAAGMGSMGGTGPPAGVVTAVECPAVTDIEGWILEDENEVSRDVTELRADDFRLCVNITY